MKRYFSYKSEKKKSRMMIRFNRQVYNVNSGESELIKEWNPSDHKINKEFKEVQAKLKEIGLVITTKPLNNESTQPESSPEKPVETKTVIELEKKIEPSKSNKKKSKKNSKK